MPELPEVETIVRELNRKISGFVFSKIVIKTSTVCETPPKKISAFVPGKKIVRVVRKGKYIGLNLNEEGFFWIHLGMTGRLQVMLKVAADKHAYMVASFKERDECLVFRDVRKFGRLFLGGADQDDQPPRIRRVGPDPFEVVDNQFKEAYRLRSGKIKSLLLNQQLISGIGNIYADESLFRSGIHPRRKPAQIKANEWVGLYESARQVLSEAIDSGGSSIDDYRRSDGSRGSFQKSHRVYGRENKPCVICGSLIRRIVISGRSSFYCSQCQK